VDVRLPKVTLGTAAEIPLNLSPIMDEFNQEEEAHRGVKLSGRREMDAERRRIIEDIGSAIGDTLVGEQEVLPVDTDLKNDAINNEFHPILSNEQVSQSISSDKTYFLSLAGKTKAPWSSDERNKPRMLQDVKYPLAHTDVLLPRRLDSGWGLATRTPHDITTRLVSVITPVILKEMNTKRMSSASPISFFSIFVAPAYPILHNVTSHPMTSSLDKPSSSRVGDNISRRGSRNGSDQVINCYDLESRRLDSSPTGLNNILEEHLATKEINCEIEHLTVPSELLRRLSQRGSVSGVRGGQEERKSVVDHQGDSEKQTKHSAVLHSSAQHTPQDLGDSTDGGDRSMRYGVYSLVGAVVASHLATVIACVIVTWFCNRARTRLYGVKTMKRKKREAAERWVMTPPTTGASSASMSPYWVRCSSAVTPGVVDLRPTAGNNTADNVSPVLAHR